MGPEANEPLRCLLDMVLTQSVADHWSGGLAARLVDNAGWPSLMCLVPGYGLILTRPSVRPRTHADLNFCASPETLYLKFIWSRNHFSF